MLSCLCKNVTCLQNVKPETCAESSDTGFNDNLPPLSGNLRFIGNENVITKIKLWLLKSKDIYA